MKRHWISLITLLGLVLASCGTLQNNGQNENPVLQETLSAPMADPQAATEQPPSPTSSMPDVPIQNAENVTFALREITEKTKADLVKQFGVDTNQIRVIEARAVAWPDASLGCPQPEMAYAQVITPGYWVLLEADGKQYPYHTDQNGQIILCLGNSSNPESDLPLIPVNPDEIDDGQPWVPVD